jgi:hypothetical protein
MHKISILLLFVTCGLVFYSCASHNPRYTRSYCYTDEIEAMDRYTIHRAYTLHDSHKKFHDPDFPTLIQSMKKTAKKHTKKKKTSEEQQRKKCATPKQLTAHELKAINLYKNKLLVLRQKTFEKLQKILSMSQPSKNTYILELSTINQQQIPKQSSKKHQCIQALN